MDTMEFKGECADVTMYSRHCGIAHFFGALAAKRMQGEEVKVWGRDTDGIWVGLQVG